MKYQDLDSYVEYLRSFPRFSPQDHLKLERIQLLLKLLGHPEKKLKGFQVAGTNGKGSTVALLESVLAEAGYRVGAFYSPHLVTYTERFRINKKEISQVRLAQLIDYLKPAVDQVESTLKDRPTWFEVLTAAAILYFYQEKVDWVIFEVGLGGRLDATSVIDLKYKIITEVSGDHTHILGQTIKKIAREKAGIIKPGNIVITSNHRIAREVIRKQCDSVKVKLLTVPEIKIQKMSFQGTKFQILDGLDKFDFEINLIGYQQAVNAALVYKLLRTILQIKPSVIQRGFKKTEIKGRFQIIDRKPLIIIDGAHNVSAIKNLLKTLGRLKIKAENLIIIFGVKTRKKYRTMIKLLGQNSKKIIFPELILPNMVLVKRLKDLYPAGQTQPSLKQALQFAKTKVQKNDIILITGSFYLVGEVLKIYHPKRYYSLDLIDDNQAEQKALLIK